MHNASSLRDKSFVPNGQGEVQEALIVDMMIDEKHESESEYTKSIDLNRDLNDRKSTHKHKASSKLVELLQAKKEANGEKKKRSKFANRVQPLIHVYDAASCQANGDATAAPLVKIPTRPFGAALEFLYILAPAIVDDEASYSCQHYFEEDEDDDGMQCLSASFMQHNQLESLSKQLRIANAMVANAGVPSPPTTGLDANYRVAANLDDDKEKDSIVNTFLKSHSVDQISYKERTLVAPYNTAKDLILVILAAPKVFVVDFILATHANAASRPACHATVAVTPHGKENTLLLIYPTIIHEENITILYADHPSHASRQIGTTNQGVDDETTIVATLQDSPLAGATQIDALTTHPAINCTTLLVVARTMAEAQFASKAVGRPKKDPRQKSITDALGVKRNNFDLNVEAPSAYIAKKNVRKFKPS
ncbi:hypothetical protein L7F22_048304 [Adiantum nelumboides]|nr:hypothetical protein [Adiantum nelumboides]